MTSQCHDRLSSGVRNDQQDAWLFKLPLEILRDIYRYLFGDRTIFVHTRWYSEPECWTHGLIIKGPDKTHNDTEDRLSFNILQSCTLAYATGIDELYYSNDFGLVVDDVPCDRAMGGGKNNAYLELVPTMVDIAKGQLERFGCQNKEIEVTLVQYVDESDEEDD
ncbi:hypothetical protein FPOAC1_009471 [Fusarium poae]|uniref:hypothetical protein n=1 Tax=Fusarium poae TaxID=36050 RepID=UPI001CE9A29B|nr:hypothetical protein FPOAC1_009471 [Fusarium poae]KAG8670068.1 hypothetical protein FPOAC1_009471 [Fusarium poae]